MHKDILKQNINAKVLITGAGGLLGTAICKYLYEHDFPIMALYKNKPREKLLWDYACADLESDDLQKISASENISVIIHCAAIIPNERYSFEWCYKVNTVIDKKISEYATTNKIEKVIFMSTTNMYGISNEVISEDTELKIDNLYSQAKVNSEELFFNLKNAEVVSLRINAPYHYLQKSNTVLKTFINKIVNGENISYHGTGSRQQDFTHTKDIAAAVMCSLRANKAGIYNIASGHAVSMKNLAELILSKVPYSKSMIFASGLADAQENHKALFDISKARNELGWQPSISLGKGIEEWIKYLQ